MLEKEITYQKVFQAPVIFTHFKGISSKYQQRLGAFRTFAVLQDINGKVW